MKSNELEAVTFDFIIIGAPKCGTTSLYEALRSHPQIYLPPDKEINFFSEDDAYNYGPTYWKSFYQLPRKHHQQRLLVGNCHNEYFVSERAPARIKSYNPEVKLLALIREPVARAWSDFLHYRRAGLEKRTFAEAIRDQLKQNKLNNYIQNPTNRYVPVGCYSQHISCYSKLFNADQLLILFSEEFRASPNDCLKKVFRHLGVSENHIPPDGSLSLNEASEPTSQLLAKTLTYIQQRPSRKVKALLRKVLGYEAMNRTKNFLSYFRQLNLGPTIQLEKDHEIEELLVGFYREEVTTIKALLGDLPLNWKTRFQERC